jgi:hypothetical protein
MSEIALEPFHSTAKVKLHLEIGHELARDLERYKQFYRQAYGADVTESDLLREMARRFMESDRDFQAAKHGLKARSRPRKAASSSGEPALEKQERQP